MNKLKILAALAAALCSASPLALAACAPADFSSSADIVPADPEIPEQSFPVDPRETDPFQTVDPSEAPPPEGLKEQSPAEPPTESLEKPPQKAEEVSYVRVTGDGVNIRSGAGTGYKSCGLAESQTLYRALGRKGNWVQVAYLGGSGYIYADYCAPVGMPAASPAVEAVIEEGAKLLGAPYVYGAVRLHDGRGNFSKDFDDTRFDCSSLMQYIFYRGAGELLDVTTRTQIYQGWHVGRASAQRGDLMFFTNASRKDRTGVERVGHVALYLGDGYILHTASDYAKIERLTPLRESYFLEARRIIR